MPAWLQAHGWREEGRNLQGTERRLISSAGQRIIAAQNMVGTSLEWRYVDLAKQEVGSIVDAVKRFLSVTDQQEVIARLRDALNSVSSAPRVNTVKPTASATSLSIEGLGRAGREYLMHELRLSEDTVDAFAYKFHQTASSAVFASHRVGNAGEVCGYGGKFFVRDDAAGSEGGRGLFVAKLAGTTEFSLILVAESFESALAAWEAIPDAALRRSSLIVSTAGDLTATGLSKLRSTAAMVWRRQTRDKASPIYLLDASGSSNEDAGQVRAESLRGVADDTNLTYHRYAPPPHTSNWSEALIAEKAGNQSAAEQASVESLVADEGVQDSAYADDPPLAADEPQQASEIPASPPRPGQRR